MIISDYARVILLRNKVLIYNSLFGGLLVFSKEIKDYIKFDGSKIVYIDENIPSKIKDRLEKNHIVSDEQDFDDIIINEKNRNLNNKAKSGELVGSIRLTLTKNCNCSCKYCYVERNYNNSKALTFEDCTKFISSSIKLSNRDAMAIRFFGGEPTLEFQLIEQVVEFVEKEYPHIKFDYIMNTNVQKITKDMISYLKMKNIKTVVSLDSIREANDYNRHSLVNDSYYEEAVKQIGNFSKEGLRFVVGSVVTNLTRKNIPKFLEEMKQLGVRNVGLNFAKMVDENMVSLDEDLARDFFNAYRYGLSNSMNVSGYWYLPFKRLIRAAGHGFCGGLGYELDLRPDRKIYTCVGASTPIGDLDSIDIIPSNPLYVNIANRIPPNINSCKGCDIEGLCAGECACDAKYATNNFFGINNRVCEFQKRLLHMLLESLIS